ncbi:MAG TPA: TolC family protein [Chitinophagaceae bacterium]|nr:TolC family protein [Chitinophagaceae bacterium]
MKKLLFALLIFAISSASAQDNSPAQGGILSKVIDIREKLVDLALRNPDNEIADLNIQAAGYTLKKTKWEWLNYVTIAGNLNEYSLRGTVSQNSLLYPKYNFGLFVPLGSFGSNAADVKLARNKLAVARAMKDNLYRKIRTETLTKYEDYLMYKQLYTLQVQLTDGANTALLESQKKFSNGEIPIEEYNNAANLYNLELVKKITALHDLNVSIFALEQLIGLDLNTVLNGQ